MHWHPHLDYSALASAPEEAEPAQTYSQPVIQTVAPEIAGRSREWLRLDSTGKAEFILVCPLAARFTATGKHRRKQILFLSHPFKADLVMFLFIHPVE